MGHVTTAGADTSVNATSEMVVFTGKLPQAIKKKLKMVSAETGKKQQDILADAIALWMKEHGF